jgi:hypothetical protein
VTRADTFKAEGHAYYSGQNYAMAMKCYISSLELAPDDHILYANLDACATRLKVLPQSRLFGRMSCWPNCDNPDFISNNVFQCKRFLAMKFTTQHDLY